ncbi:MAG: aminopeptidase P family protein [Burkholderiales bacterium]|nr:aminopeptidase P family protein [Phycisphaerae bacterium]
MLDPILARQRQKRLLDRLSEHSLDCVVISQPHHVQYLTAHHPAWRHLPALILRSDGRATLISANAPAKNVAADEVIAYRANLGGTLRQDQAATVIELLKDQIASSKRIGFDSSETSAAMMSSLIGDKAYICIDDHLWQLRRTKDADELTLMKKAIDATAAMYARAREIIEPGVSETYVFNELHAAAVQSTGEPMTALLGNDYACGTGGGLPRAGRRAQDGELYILDIGPTYRGYFADNARVFAVGGKPTDEQLSAWQMIVDVFPIVERLARPGASCRDIYAAVDEHFAGRNMGRKQGHHLGHGIGLQAHEYPHLNPAWDDVLIEGEIFTCEPGVYLPELRGGLRIENQYLVTHNGVENLTPFPLAL